MFKKYLLILVILFSSILFFGVDAFEVGDKNIKDSLIKISDSDVISGVSDEDGLTFLSTLLIWIKDTLTGFVLLISIGVFLFIGIRLGIARGNPDEFKKALMHFVYAVIGVFVISIAWATVVLVSGLNL